MAEIDNRALFKEWFKSDSRFSEALDAFQAAADQDLTGYREQVLRDLQGVDTNDGSVQVFDGDGEERRLVMAFTVNSWAFAKDETTGGRRHIILILEGFDYRPYVESEDMIEDMVNEDFTVLVLVRAEVKEHIAFENVKVTAITKVKNAWMLSLLQK